MKGLHLVLRLSVPRGWCDQVAPQLRTALEQAPFWGALRLLEMHEESKPKKLTPSAFTRALKDEGSRGWKLFSDEQEARSLVSLGLEKTGISATLRIRLHDQAWKELSSLTLDWMIRCLAILSHPKLLPSSGVSLDFVPDLPWQQLPDFPTAPYVFPENVVDIVDERIIGHFRQGDGDAVVARMLASPPREFHRELKEGYAILSFTDDLTDEDKLVSGRERHERWLAKMIVPD